MPIFVHQSVFKRNSQILLRILLHFQKPLLPVSFLGQHLYITVLYQKLIIEDILDLRAVDGQQPVAGLQFQFFRNAPGKNIPDHMFFFLHFHFSCFSAIFYYRCFNILLTSQRRNDIK